VAGHDRGALVAFRTAMDHPDAVQRLVIMDGLPVIEHLERLNEAFVRTWWHWWVPGPDRQTSGGIHQRRSRALVPDPASGRDGGRKPVLLVSTEDDLGIHGGPEAIWRSWTAGELRSRPIHSGHHQAEQAPDELASALLEFLGASRCDKSR
jgi:haloacetate dehalogenase